MPSRLYYAPETKITFKGSGGDALITFATTPDGRVAASAQYDRGADSRPGLYRWRCKITANGSPSAGTLASLFLAQTDDNTDIPSRLSTSDQELSAANSFNATRNLGQTIGCINVDSNSADQTFTATGVCFVYFRYITFVIYNQIGVAFSSTESDHYFEMTPIPPEFQ